MPNKSQGEITETSPSGPARPRSEADRGVSTFSRSNLTPSQTHRISTKERPTAPLSPSKRLRHLPGGGLEKSEMPPAGSTDPISK